MNLYEKIQAIRVDLANADIKMSGQNTYAAYDYFELSDFVKPLNELMTKYKICAFASFTADIATLTVVNSEKPDETLSITSPMGTAQLKGCHEVQNIGAVETYQRRYLYLAMFDIAENDELNATQDKDKPPFGKKPPVNTQNKDGAKSSADRPMSLTEAEKVKIKTNNGAEVLVLSLSDEQLDKLLQTTDEYLKTQRSAAKIIAAMRRTAN